MTKRNHCKGCIHHRRFTASFQEKYCLYILDTGEKRNCPPECCDKKDTDKSHLPKKPNFTLGE